MTRTHPRSNLHSSLLIRTLMDMETAYLSPAPDDLAQTLGQWISFVDASSLSAAQPMVANTQAVVSFDKVALAQEFSALRGEMEDAIFQRGRHAKVAARLALPVPDLKHSVDDASNYAPYRRYHQAHQQHMELKVRQVRARVRDRISRCSTRLRPLVTLDASLERILGEREAVRLGNIPAVFERRFKLGLKAHQDRLQASESDSVALWLSPDGWLTRFHLELQAALHAELDLRLQTTVGLVKAFDNEQTHNT